MAAHGRFMQHANLEVPCCHPHSEHLPQSYCTYDDALAPLRRAKRAADTFASIELYTRCTCGYGRDYGGDFERGDCLGGKGAHAWAEA